MIVWMKELFNTEARARDKRKKVKKENMIVIKW